MKRREPTSATRLCYGLFLGLLALSVSLGAGLSFAADGDFAVYRESTANETITTTATDQTWDTTVTQGSGFTIDGGRVNVDLSLAGHYLVMYNSSFLEATGRRFETQNWLSLGGSIIPYGQSTGYIRRSGGTNESWQFGAAIIEATAGQDIKVVAQRTDDETATPNRQANSSGLMVLKLPDTWNFARIREAGGGQVFTSTSFTAVTWDTNDELDTGSFTHTGDTDQITLVEAGHYMVTANVHLQTTGTTRTSFQMRLTLDGTEINGTRTTFYPRGSDSNHDHRGVFAGIINVSSNDVLRFEIAKETGSNATMITSGSGITIAKLPETADYVRLGKTNTQAVDGTDDPITWNQSLEVDSGSFSHSSNLVNIDQDGDYLFFSTYYASKPSTVDTRLYPHWEWRKTGTKYQYGSSGKYNRGNGSLICGNSLGIIASGLLDTDNIDVVNTDEGTGTDATLVFEANRMGLQGVRIASLLPLLTPAITDVSPSAVIDLETGVVITGTDFGATQGTGTVELGSTNDYATAAKVAQTVTNWGDLSVTFTVAQGALSSGTVWVYVTGDNGETSPGYSISLVTAPSITNVNPSTFGDQDTGIVITGSNLGASQGTGTVELGDNSDYGSATLVEQTVTDWGDGSITFTAAQGALSEGNVWVFVTTDDGKTTAGLAATLVDLPAITNVNPTSFIDAETGVIVTGSDFGASQGTGKIELGNNSDYGSATLVEQTVTNWGDGSLTFTVAQGGLSAGGLWVFVTTDNGHTSAGSAVTLIDVPDITDVSPASVLDAQTGVVITGTDFLATQGTGKIELGSSSTYASATKVTQTVTNWGDASLTFTAVQGALSTGNVWVYVTTDNGHVSSGFRITLSTTSSAQFQKGESTIPSGQTSVTQSITAVDQSRAFLMMWSTGDSGSDWAEAWQATGYFSANNEITFVRSGTRDDCRIGWQVVEVQNEEFEVVARGSITIAGASASQDADIGVTIDQTRTFIVTSSAVSSNSGNDDNVQEGYATVHFVDNDTIRATRGTSGTQSCVVRYEVVEWHQNSGVTVQTKEYNGAIGTTEVTDTITTAVTPGRTWLYATFSHAGGSGLSQTAVNTYLKDGSTIGFRRYQNSYTSGVRWWAIQFPADVSVQHVSDTSLSTDTTRVTNISSVTTDTTFLDLYNNCNGTGQALPRQEWYPVLTSATQVTSTRYYNGQISNLSIQAIDMTAWNFISSDPPALTNVNPSSFGDGTTNINITGTDFGASQGTGVVELGDASTYGASSLVAQTVTGWGDSSITITASQSFLDPGNVWVYVTNDLGQTSTGYQVTMLGPPSLTDVAPDPIVDGQTSVVLSGTNFYASQGSGTIELGSTSDYATATKVSQTVTDWQDTAVTFTVSQGALSTGQVWAFATNDDGYTSSGEAVTLVDAPAVTNVNPATFVDAQTGIDITGSDFLASQGTGKVELGDNSNYSAATKVAQTVTSWGDGSITFTANQGALSTGTVYVFVTTDNGHTSSGYSVTLADPPTMTNINPDSFVDAQTGIDITGSYFEASQGTGKVELANGSNYAAATKEEQTVTSWGAGTITFTSDQGTILSGNAWVFVTNDSGFRSTGYAVTILDPPTISGVNPDTVAGGQTSVVISGLDFEAAQGTGTVELGDSSTYATATKELQTVTDWQDTAVTITVNQGALSAGNVWVYVTTDNGNTTAGYQITLETAPSISNVSPDTVVDGTVGVTVTGADFLSTQGTGMVELGDNSDYASANLVTQTVTDWASGSILFNVSQGALGTGTVYVFVTTDSGYTSAGSAITLTVGPGITGVNPSQFISGETGIVISGSLFGATQGSGKVELANSSNYSQATKITQTITNWGAGSITFTSVFGPLSSGTNYVFVTDDNGVTSAGYQITLLEPPTTSLVNPDSFADASSGIVISGVYFGSAQGTGKVELGDADTYAVSTKVAQTVTNWGDTSVTFTSVQGGHSSGTLWVYLTNDSGYTSGGYEVTLSPPPAAGVATIGVGTASVTEPISPVLSSMSNAFLLVMATGGSGTDASENHQATGYISATNQVVFERAGTADDCQIGYQIVQAENQEFEVVARGEITIPAASLTADVDLPSAVTQTRSFIIANSRIGATGGLDDNEHKGKATVHFVDDDTIRATRGASGTYSCTVRYEVVQWHEDSGVTVQTKEYSGTIGATEVTDAITTAVTTTRTWLYATFAHAGGSGLSQTAVNTYLKDGSTVGFSRYTGSYASAIRWWAIEFPAASNVTVQHLSDLAASGDVLALTPITAVDASYAFVDLYNDSNGTGQALPRHCWHAHITSSTEVTSTRYYSGQAANLSVQVMDLSSWNFAPIVDTTPPTNPTTPASAWDTSGKTNVLPNNTWQYDYNSVYIEWSGATDPEPDPSGVSGYSIYQGVASDGEPGLTEEQSAESFDAGTAPSDGIYYIRLRTFDVDGNYSPAVTMFVFKYDATAPTNPTAPASAWETSSKINAITDDTWQSDDQTPYFEWSGASDVTAGVSGYSVYWGTASDGEPGTTQEQTETTYEIITPTGEGTYYLRVRTFDDAGNYSDPATLFTFRYDETVPTNPTIPASAWDSNAKGTVISDSVPQNDDDTPYFEWTGATDATAGVAGYSVYWGTATDGEPGLTQEVTAATFDMTVPTGDGTYYLRLRTFDEAGNYSDPVTAFTFIYDNTKPTVSISVTPNPTGHILTGALEFVLTFSESMDTGTTPTVSYDPAGVTGAQTVSTSGAWSTTTYTDDTYTAYNDSAINSSTGDGSASISVSGAQDVATSVMDPDTDDTLTIDTAVHHFKIEHDSQGLINVAENITVTAKTQYGHTDTDYTDQITVSTVGETAQISWAVDTGNGSFADGGTDNNSATYTYNGTDGGVVVLDMTSTAADFLDVEATDGSYYDDDTEGNLVVSSFALDHFVISHDTAGTAGQAETITVTAINTESETKTDYVGTITLDTDGSAADISWALSSGQGAFNDGGGASDTATYTYTINDNGVATFTITDTKAEDLDVDCSDGSFVDDDSDNLLVITAAALDNFDVSHDNAAVAGTPEQITILAHDAYENLIKDYQGTITLDTDGTATTITWALDTGAGSFNDGGAGVDTATYTFHDNDDGQAVFTLTDTKTESIDIDISGDGKSDMDDEGDLVVAPATLSYFLVSHDNSASAGVAEQVTVTAYDANDNIKMDYTGTVTLDTAAGTVTTITWAKQTGNGSFADGGAGVDTATYTFVGSDNGTAVFTITDTIQESLDIEVSDGPQTDTDAEGLLVVGPPEIWSFDISHGGSTNAGVPVDITITAKDSLGATMTGYTGQITVDTDGTADAISWTLTTGSGTFNDGGASVDTATYTFVSGDSGVVVLEITPNAVEQLDIDVSGDSKTDDDTEGDLVVGAAILDHFEVSHDNAATAGTGETITITATNSLGNTMANYEALTTIDTDGDTNTITWALDTGSGVFNDGGAEADTCTYDFDATDNGVVVLTLTDTLVETIDIDVSGDGKVDDDTEGTLVVSPGALDHFLVDHDGSALVDIAEPVTITAKDVNDNTVTSHTGQINVDTNGTPTTIAWALQGGNGTFNDGGSAVDSCTYTFVGSDSGTVSLTVANSSTESIDIDVYGATKYDDDTEGFLDFSSASDIIIDEEDLSPTYTEGGTWQNATGGTEYGTRSRRHDGANTGAWARWTPSITVAGNYEVYNMGRSINSNWATTAHFYIHYDGGVSDAIIVDQTTYGNPNWIYLGDGRLSVGTSEYLELTDTDQGGARLSADVTKFVLKGIGTATANSVTTSSVGAGTNDNLILDFTVSNQFSAQDTVTTITVENAGTATDAELESVKLYYDSNSSGDYTSGVDTQIGSGTFAAGSKTFSGLNITLNASGGSERFFVVVDVASSATDGNTVDVGVEADGITLTNGGILVKNGLNSAGTREIDVVLNHFVITHDGYSIAGSDENITITAKDSSGNTKTDYTGQITVDTNGTVDPIVWALQTGDGSFADGGAGDDTATYTFSVADDGVVILTVNDTIAETINVSVAGDGKTDDDTEGNLVIDPASVDHFVLSHDNAAVAGTSETVSLTVEDVYDNTITDYTSQVTLDTNGTATAVTWALSSGFGSFADGGASVDTATYTFHSSDNGAATFTVTDNVPETINISISGDGKTDDNTEGDLVVSPASLDKFVISHDGTAQAGTAEDITITAKDTLGNTKTDYTGTITIDTTGTPTTITWAKVTGDGTLIEGGASVDTATYEYASSDNGVVTLSLTDTKTETLNISVAGDNKSDDNTEGDLEIEPGTLDHFIITHDGTGVTGISEDVSVTAYDTEDNIKTDYTGQVTLDTNGTTTTITWTLNSGNGTFQDNGDNYDTATYTFVEADNGTASYGMVDFAAETLNIAASDGGVTDDNSEGGLEIISSGIDHFLVAHDNSGIAGQAETVTIYAKDGNNDTITIYQGSIVIDTNGDTDAITWALDTGSGSFADGGAGVDTATYTYNLADNGAVILTLTDTTEETINISVSGEGKTDDNTEGNLVFNPSGLHHFSVSHDGNADAGVSDNVTITAKDANDDAVTNYTGQITVDTNGTVSAVTWAKVTGNGSFAEGGPAVDTATYTYVASDNGVCILSVADNKVETINISVSGGGKTDDDEEGTISVGPGAIDHFVITHDGSAEAGVADNVTIRAEDAYDNLKTDYTGQITLDTDGTATEITWAKVSGNGTFLDGGGSLDTATYTFHSTDSGQATFSVSDTTSESLDVAVSGDGKFDDDSEGDLVVGAAGLNYFVVAHDTSANAGVAEDITVTAYDTYDNVKENYTGQITLDTNGTASTITWALGTGNGTFLDGGASVDTATYTFAESDDGVVILTVSDTKTESIDVDVSGGGKTDTDAEGSLTVGPTSIDHFVIVHDGDAGAGIADNVTITAYDTYSNIKDDYAAQITVDTDGTANTITWAKVTGDGSFADGGGSVDTATYTYAGSDDGVVTLSVTDTTLEDLDISVLGSGKTDDDTEGLLAVGPGVIDSFVVVHDGSAVQSVADDVSVTAKDSYGNTKTDYTGTVTLSTSGESGEIAWALKTGSGSFNDNGSGNDSATYGYSLSDSGVAVFTITPAEADTLNIAVSGDGQSDDDTEGNLVVQASSVTADATANPVTTATADAGDTAVVLLDVTVTNNNILTGDTITSVTINNAGTSSDSEIASVKLYIDSNNSDEFESVSDTQVGSGTFTSGSKVFSGLSISIAASGSETLFAVFDVATTIDDGDTLDASIPVNGIALSSAPTIEDAILNSSGTREIILTLDHFVITHDGSAQAGVAENVVVTAKDAYENIKTSYEGTISLDTDGTATAVSWGLQSGNGSLVDDGPSVDTASYTFVAMDNGSATLTVTDTIAETIDISVSGSSKSDDDTEGDLVVSAGSLDHFVISHDGSAVAGVADNVTVTAKDANENTISNYEGEITLDTVDGTEGTIEWGVISGFGVFNDGGASVDTATYTFHSSDNSTATFSINDTTAESLNISVSGDGQNDDNSEGTLTVVPNALDHFVVSHDGSAQAGVADNVTITAEDAYDNTITTYTGQITVDTDGTAASIEWAKVTGAGTFVDGGVGVDTATYTYNGSDNGVVVLSVEDTALEDLDISVSGDGKSDDNSHGLLTVGAGLIDHFEITHDGLATQNQAENIIIKAYDAYGNIQDNYTGEITVDTNGTADSITWAKVTGDGSFSEGGSSVDTATYTYVGTDNGEVTLSITDTTAEIINISVSGDGRTDDDNEGVLEIVAAGFHHFKIVHDSNAVVGSPEQITIMAKDAGDATVDNYVGVMTVDTNGTASAITWGLDTGDGTFNDGGSSVDTATYEFVSGDSGQVILTITDTVQETINISATGSGKADDNTEGPLAFNPTGIHHFVVTHDGAATAGTPDNVTITAKDANGQTLTGYTSSITIDTDGTAGTIAWANVSGVGTFEDGGAAVDTATYAYASGDSGAVTLTVTDLRVETFNVSVSGDGKTDDGTDGNIVVSPGVIESFLIDHDGSALAGVADDVTVTAKDAYGNTLPTYAGSITLDTDGTASTITWGKTTGQGVFNDGGAGVGTATYSFVLADNGVAVFNVTDTTRENLDLAVTGSGKTDDDTEGLLSVAAGAINKFIVSHDNSASAGAPEAVSVTAYDVYDNIKTNYLGTITLDTDGTASAITWALSSGQGSFVDGGAGVDTATYTYVSGDSGTAAFTITDTAAETIDIDVSGSGKFDDDSEGNLVVTAGGLHHFLIAHDGTAEAGTPEDIAIYAKDISNNTLADYEGQITVDTNGSADKITWANSSGGGAFADGGASVDTATYTYVLGDSGVVTLTLSDTKTETINISVAGDGKYDNNTEGDLVVDPGALTHFVITHDGQAIQSVGEDITVTAKDSYENDKTNYSGTVTLGTTNGSADSISWALTSGSGGFVDNGPTVDTATYSFVLQDSGTADFQFTDTVAETVDLSVVDGGTTDDNTEGSLVIQASSTTVSGTVNDLTSGFVAQGETGMHVLDITLTNNDVIDSDTLQTLTVENVGTIADNEVNAVKLYYDSNNSNSYTPGVDSQIATGSFSGGGIIFTDVDLSITEAGTEELYLVIDLKSSVSDGATVDVRIPANGMTFLNAPDAPETLLNSSGQLTVDAASPGEVAALASSSHDSAVGTWDDPQSRDSTVSVSWSPAADTGSGVDGYAVLWDTNPTTLPSPSKGIEETASFNTSTSLSDGDSYYFHIRSVDNVGNWDTTAQHIGPFYVDTTGPASTSIYQITEFAGGDYLHIVGNTVYYSGLSYGAFKVYVEAADALAGLSQAVFPTTVSVGGTDGTEEGGAYEYVYTYEVSSAGSTYNNANVVVYDNAGNQTDVPFSVVLDSAAPNSISSLTSSTHTPGVSSSNNDVTLNWSDVDDSQSGTVGYSIIMDTGSDTLPPKYINVNSGVQTYTESDLDNGTYYAHIRAVDKVGNWSGATHAGPFIIGRGTLTSALTASQSIVSTDQAFTVTMTVQNPGSTGIDDVDPSVLTVNSTGGASASTGTNPSPQNIDASGQKQYQWTYTAGSSAGTINFEGYAQGTDQEGTIISDTVKSSDVTVEGKCALSLGVSASPSSVSTSETVTIVVTVTNSGQADAIGVVPSLSPSGSASPSVSTGPSPSSATIRGGASKQFTFTGYGSSAGTATFTAGISSGTDENSGTQLTATSAQDSVSVAAPPSFSLTSSIAATPTAVDTGGTVTVTMTVQNTGSSTLNTVTPSTITVGGTSSDATLATGPIPTSVSTLTGGATQAFVWTYTAGTTLGTLTFTGNATSSQANSSTTSSSAISIQTGPSTVSSSIAATPTSLLTNASITVTMTVNNTGGTGSAAANNVSPSVLTLGGTSGEANLQSGPAPSSADIAPGGSADFVWSYKAGNTAGTVNFTGNATGTDANSGSDASSTASTSNNVTVSTLSPAWTYPTGASATGPIRSVPISFPGMDDRVYFGSDDNTLYVVDGTTHELQFSFESSGDIRGLPYPSTEQRIGVWTDIVYFGTLGKTVYGLWADNTLRWERILGEELSTTVLYDYASNIYFGTVGQDVYCIGNTDGVDVWVDTTTVGGAIESAPASIEVPTLNYDEIYFGASDGKVYGFKAEDGTGSRIFDTGFGEAGAIKTAPNIALQDPGSPATTRRLLLFGTENGRFYAVNTANLSASEADTGWATNPYVTGGSNFSAPWVDLDSGYVFFGSQDGKLYALSLEDGTMKANFPVNVGSPIDSWPLVYNGVIYFGADDGKVYAVNVSTGQIVPGWPYDTGSPVKSGAAQHVIYDQEWNVLEVYIMIGSDSGKIYTFQSEDLN